MQHQDMLVDTISGLEMLFTTKHGGNAGLPFLLKQIDKFDENVLKCILNYIFFNMIILYKIYNNGSIY